MTTPAPNEFTFTITSSGPDGNGNITDIDGWDLARYTLNPVVFFNHQWNNPPVGRTLRLERVGETITARIAMAPSAMGQELTKLIDSGFLNGASTGWRPTEWELRRDDKSRILGIHSHHQELLEVSIVGLPARADTLRQAALQDSLQADYRNTLTPAAVLEDLSQINVLISTSIPAEFEIPRAPEITEPSDQDQERIILTQLETFNSNLRGTTR